MRPRTVERRVDFVGQIFVPQPGTEVGVQVFDDHAPIRAFGGVVKLLLLFWKCEGECRRHL
jgi:hypothetical protein